VAGWLAGWLLQLQELLLMLLQAQVPLKLADAPTNAGFPID
jgi:hypothetical protein